MNGSRFAETVSTQLMPSSAIPSWSAMILATSTSKPSGSFVAGLSRPKPGWSNFDYADALNEFLMLGNIATQFEETLEFDPVAMKIVNNAEADAMLRSEYREGWTL